MFNKLKRKIIFTIMTLLTLVFISIFGTIYFSNYNSMERDLEMNLKNAMYNPKKPTSNNPMMLGSVIIDLNPNNEISNIHTLLDINEENLKDVVEKINTNENKLGKIKLEGSSFSYLKDNDIKGSKIVLINREYQKNLLNGILRTFLIIGGISLLVLLAVSIFITNKILQPVIESFERQKQFIADASHELKTPLAIIKTNSSVIKGNKYESVLSQMKWLNYIEDQSSRMGELIEEMLSLAKLDSEKELLNFSNFDISHLVDNIILTFEAVIFENNIEFESDIKQEIYVRGDKEKIKKAITILLDNAIKYTNKNGKISVFVKEDKSKVKIIVKNTGEGIKKEDLDKIFERFYRVDGSRTRETGGYGLGLAIAKSIIETHKGKIYANSTIGEETTFTIELSLVQNTQKVLSET